MSAVILTQPKKKKEQFEHLKASRAAGVGDLGGRFRLPQEFDSTKFAAAFYQEGQEALAMEADQQVTGTRYTATGWTVWKYPKHRMVGEEKEAHPMAGQPHKVAGTAKDTQGFVLMYRPLEVQNEVNAAYAEASREMLEMEIKGETTQLSDAERESILTEANLKREAGIEQDIEGFKPGEAVVHGQPTPSSPHIGPSRTKKVRK